MTSTTYGDWLVAQAVFFGLEAATLMQAPARGPWLDDAAASAARLAGHFARAYLDLEALR